MPGRELLSVTSRPAASGTVRPALAEHMHTLMHGCRQCARYDAARSQTGGWNPSPPAISPPRRSYLSGEEVSSLLGMLVSLLGESESVRRRKKLGLAGLLGETSHGRGEEIMFFFKGASSQIQISRDVMRRPRDLNSAAEGSG